MPTERPVILFDGFCSLCDRAVDFVIARDPAARFRFVALQSEEGRSLVESIDAEGPAADSVMLIEGESLFTGSTAVLRIVRRLRMPWPILYGFVVVPRFIRDVAYDWVARNRYGWFGRRDSCRLPPPDRR